MWTTNCHTSNPTVVGPHGGDDIQIAPGVVFLRFETYQNGRFFIGSNKNNPFDVVFQSERWVNLPINEDRAGVASFLE